VQRDAVVEGALVNALRVEPEPGSTTRGGTPGPVVERFNRDFNDSLAKPGVEAALRRFGLKPEAIGPRELGRRVYADHAAIGAALRRLEIA
jgi:tripartite-type tricarboxylate transporter receptor subunit TctC